MALDEIMQGLAQLKQGIKEYEQRIELVGKRFPKIRIERFLEALKQTDLRKWRKGKHIFYSPMCAPSFEPLMDFFKRCNRQYQTALFFLMDGYDQLDFRKKLSGNCAKMEHLPKNSVSVGKLSDVVDDILHDENLATFLSHDCWHLLEDFLNMFNYYGLSRQGFENLRKSVDERVGLYEKLNSDPAYIARSLLEPFRLAQYVIEAKFDLEHECWSFNPKEIVETTQDILNSRITYQGITIGEVITRSEDFEMYGNSGVFWSVIYNLAKNSVKKFMEDYIKDKVTRDNRVYIDVYKANGCCVVTVADNGDPISLDKMKEKIRETIVYEGIDALGFWDKGTKRRIEGWVKSPYKVVELTVDDLLPTSRYVIRSSGLDMKQKAVNSGMGLYGIRYLSECLDGAVMYGECINTGSPLFTFVLPINFQQPNKQKVGEVVYQLEELGKVA